MDYIRPVVVMCLLVMSIGCQSLRITPHAVYMVRCQVYRPSADVNTAALHADGELFRRSWSSWNYELKGDDSVCYLEISVLRCSRSSTGLVSRLALSPPSFADNFFDSNDTRYDSFIPGSTVIIKTEWRPEVETLLVAVDGTSRFGDALSYGTSFELHGILSQEAAFHVDSTVMILVDPGGSSARNGEARDGVLPEPP